MIVVGAFVETMHWCVQAVGIASSAKSYVGDVVGGGTRGRLSGDRFRGVLTCT